MLIRSTMWTLLAGISILILQINIVHGGGTVEVQLVSYTYLDNGNQTSLCCDVIQNSSCNGCDPYVEISLSDQSNLKIPISKVEVTKQYSNTNQVNFTSADGSFDLSFDKFQSTFFLVLRIFDGSMATSTRLLDELNFRVGQGEPSSFNSHPAYTVRTVQGISVKMEFKYIIKCDQYYYGYCSVFCKPIPGQYTCSRQGRRVCETGWSGVNCTIHTIDVFCKDTTCLNGATCVNVTANVTHCTCLPGFGGKHCETNLQQSTTKQPTSTKRSSTKPTTSKMGDSTISSLNASQKTVTVTLPSTRPPALGMTSPTLASLILTIKMGTLSPDTDNPVESRDLTGVIVGSVVGLILLLAIVMGIIFLIWKKNGRKVNNASMLPTAELKN